VIAYDTLRFHNFDVARLTLRDTSHHSPPMDAPSQPPESVLHALDYAA
jgi:hypothetical protein